jgi:hypothetical protein
LDLIRSNTGFNGAGLTDLTGASFSMISMN